MKTSLTKLSSSLILITFSFSLLAKPVAQVVEVTGTVFSITAEGKTRSLKLNDHLDENSEVLVEEGASLTLNDYYDASYHLIGGTHLKFFNRSVQLKKGKSWIQANGTKYPLSLTTANGNVEFSKGEFIATFDQTNSRTQVLVVNGEVDVSNVLDKTMKVTTTAGSFTMLDPEIEAGVPRSPTPIGLQSLEAGLSEFKRLPTSILDKKVPSALTEQQNTSPVQKNQNLARGIASLNEPVGHVKKGQIIFIKSHRVPASVPKGVAHAYFKKVVSKKAQLPPVPLKYYGTSWSEVTPILKPVTEPPRVPASVGGDVKKNFGSDSRVTEPVSFKIDQDFSQSLKAHESEQPKHPKELQNLINDLKSY